MAARIAGQGHGGARFTGASRRPRGAAGRRAAGDWSDSVGGDAPAIGERLLAALADRMPAPAPRQTWRRLRMPHMADPFAALEARFGEALLRDEPLVRYTWRARRPGGRPGDGSFLPGPGRAVGLAHEAGCPGWCWRRANVLIRGSRRARAGDCQPRARDGLRRRWAGWAESGASLSTVARKASNGAWAVLSGANVPARSAGRWSATPGRTAARSRGSSSTRSTRQRGCCAALRWTPTICATATGLGAQRTARSLRAAAASSNWKPGHDPKALNERIAELAVRRKRTQPPGRRWAHVQEPAGEHAGRLIEAAGLKARRSAA